MTVLEIYEKVNIRTPLEQRIFFNYLNDSVNEISELYGDMPKTVFIGNIISADVVPISTLEDEMVLKPMYHNAVVDNILFLCGQGSDPNEVREHKGEFVRKTKEAYLHYWGLYSRGKHVKRNRW